PAHRTADVVQRLRQAGAVIVGTTNMTEFAYSGLGINPHYGTPRNPWQRDEGGGRIPGGSSSGAAISVTDGMAMAAIGSDTGGSVRIPSALCGLTGFKPTARRVSMEGVLPLSANLDSIGPLAPSVRCCATLDAILSGEPLGELHAAPLQGLRLLAPTNVVLDGMDATVAAAWERALSLLSQAGAHITHVVVAPFGELADINSKGGFTAAEAWAWHRHHIATRLSEYDPRVGTRILRGKDISAADYIDLLARRRQWIAAVSAQMADHDLIVMPTVPVVAPKIADLTQSDEAYFGANGLILRNPTLINFLDGCAISLPCHRAGEAPVGLSLAGLGGQDRRLLSVALAVEQLLASAQG
ncbi:MAG: amidase, partial [Delftia acidovorans]|nr:amidase [Delftia acidovorans]